MSKKDKGYDEAFKDLIKYYFEPFARVITDYELLDLPKRLDVLIIEVEKSIIEHVKIFTYFKRYNIIEFKSESDRFKLNEDLYQIGIYINGVPLKEKEANYKNTTFTLATTFKPKKLLKIFNAKEAKKGLYEIDNISLIPIHILVLEELEIDLEKDAEILKVFTSLKDRDKFIDKEIDNLNQNSKEIKKILETTIGLYKDEFLYILSRKGINMNRYEQNLMDVFEMSGIKEKVYQKGKEEGKINGEEKGKEEGKLETAKNALIIGLPDDIIKQITGLSLENILDLKNKLN